MMSGILTLFNWTLKMDAKSIFPYIVRAVFALLLLIAISASVADAFGANSVGLNLFQSICFMNVALITVSGVSYFVTAVTEEKDAGTYALLRLAGMTPLAITLGKSTSRLVSSLMLLIIQLPFTFLSITLGGILWTQIIAAYLALAAWMVLIANLSLFCSVRCATSGRAAGLAGSILTLFFALPPIITNGLAAVPPGAVSASVASTLQSVVSSLRTVSVVERLGALFQPGSTVVFLPGQFWANILLGLFFFVISTLTLDWWSAPSEPGGVAENKKIRRWTVGRCWRFPIAWKEFLYFTGGRSFFVRKLIGGAVIYAAFVFYQSLDGTPISLQLRNDNGWNALLTFAGCLTVEVMMYSSGCLFFEVRQLTQSTLATAPISSVRVLLEKFLGCSLALIPTVLWIGITMIMGYQSIARVLELTMVISFLVMLSFSSHVAALLSLYTRWAALPLTILLAVPAFAFLSMPILVLSLTTTRVAATQGLPAGSVVVILVNIFWTWLFILLPLEFWIRDRWAVVSQKS